MLRLLQGLTGFLLALLFVNSVVVPTPFLPKQLMMVFVIVILVGLLCLTVRHMVEWSVYGMMRSLFCVALLIMLVALSALSWLWPSQRLTLSEGQTMTIKQGSWQDYQIQIEDVARQGNSPQVECAVTYPNDMTVHHQLQLAQKASYPHMSVLLLEKQPSGDVVILLRNPWLPEVVNVGFILLAIAFFGCSLAGRLRKRRGKA